METLKAIETRRSIRRFRGEVPPDNLIEKIVGEAAFAPSWKNTQTAGYIAIKGENKDKIAAEMLAPHNAAIVNSAPVLIAMVTKCGRCGCERDGSFTTKKEDRWQYFDAGIACQTFCLAAHDCGLATVIMGIYDEDKLPAFLKLGDDEVLTALIALGYAAEQPDCPPKKSVNELLSYL